MVWLVLLRFECSLRICLDMGVVVFAFDSLLCVGFCVFINSLGLILAKLRTFAIWDIGGSDNFRLNPWVVLS